MEHEAEVTVTVRIPKGDDRRGQIRFAGVVFYDRGPGVAKCREDIAPASVRPVAQVRALVAVGA